ncbi:MAG: HEAT repeat domain-containing protein, partial [Anaerolineae bacterium]|nr:HEAT repeat domain-containing protein [Anaerolineae bacterium]
RCISYLTIEQKGVIPVELRAGLGNRVFGCDVCNEVCPWNKRFARATDEPALQPDPSRVAPPLLELIGLDEPGFRARFRGSPVLRAKRRGLLRNVCVALGNWGDPAAIGPLTTTLADAEPLIRQHAAWALGRIDNAKASQALSQRLIVETDSTVREELIDALESRKT